MDRCGQGVDGMQHAVDADPHYGALALRLDVNVRGTVVEGVAQQVVHCLDDGLVRGVEFASGGKGDQLLEVLQLGTGGRKVARRLGQSALEAVDVRDAAQDVRLGGQHRNHWHPSQPSDAFHRLPVEGVGGGHHQRPLRRALQGKNDVLLRVRTRHGAGGQGHVELQRVDFSVGDAQGLGHRFADAVLVEHAAVAERYLKHGHQLDGGHRVPGLVLLPAHLLQHPHLRRRLLGGQIMGLRGGEELTRHQN